MTTTNPYFDELRDIHVEIQSLFDGSANEGALERIMARFAPQFTLFTPQGAARGPARKSRSPIWRLEIVAEYPSAAVVKYREYQRDNAGNANVRRSIAVMDLGANVQVMWRHLQETFCTE